MLLLQESSESMDNPETKGPIFIKIVFVGNNSYQKENINRAKVWVGGGWEIWKFRGYIVFLHVSEIERENTLCVGIRKCEGYDGCGGVGGEIGQ